MNGITIYEFDALVASKSDAVSADGLHRIPYKVYSWLEDQCFRTAEEGAAAWLKLTQRHGRRVVQVTSFVGVIRGPDGFQIEVLPKVGKAIGGGSKEARQLLIEMLCCLQEFRHVETESAKISAARMPLLEVFIAEFLRTIEHVVKRGLRSDYSSRQGNLFSLRGKLLSAPHLRQNLYRADRFFTEHDEFSADRPENRVLRSALLRAMELTSSATNQQLARELQFVYADVPVSAQPWVDFQRARLDRGMGQYAAALGWARLILGDLSPVTGLGAHRAPSLLFPMEAVFEAFVANHIARQLARPLILKTQPRSHHLVRHRGQNWFRLQPDLLVREHGRDALVMDTKWKLLDRLKANGTDKYGLLQSDFYQLQAYGQSYLDGEGDVALIYPMTAAFDRPLPVFELPKSQGLRLWVLPFCLKSRRLDCPDGLHRWSGRLNPGSSVEAALPSVAKPNALRTL